MNEKEIIEKIKQRKQYSGILDSSVKRVLDSVKGDDEDKIKKTRSNLRKVFSAFLTNKVLKGKIKDSKIILKSHVSTRERADFYLEIYKRILKGLDKKISVIDLGAGVNGFSYDYFNKLNYDVDYIGIEAIKQLVDLTNSYFNENKINGKMIYEDLFNLDKIIKIIENTEKPRVVFMFKIIDALEFLKRDYSKELILKISEKAERIVISFATASLGNKQRFKAQRYWLINFINENFHVLDDFCISNERFIVFEKKKQ